MDGLDANIRRLKRWIHRLFHRKQYITITVTDDTGLSKRNVVKLCDEYLADIQDDMEWR